MAKNDTTSTKALIVALLGALGTALTVVTSPTNTTGATAVIAVFLSSVATTVGAYLVPNRPKAVVTQPPVDVSVASPANSVESDAPARPAVPSDAPLNIKGV